MTQTGVMYNDKAIEFQAILRNIKNKLIEMNSIGLQVKEYEEILKQIEEEVKNNNRNSYSSNKSFSGFLENNYIQGISKLNKLRLELAKYDVYFEVHYFSLNLKNIVENEKINEEQRDYFNGLIKEYANRLKYSNTLDYQVEGSIVENFYHIVYLYIKMEFELFSKSDILNSLNKNEIDASFLNSEVLEDIRSIDFESKDYEMARVVLTELKAKNVPNCYATEEFLVALINSKNSKKIIAEVEKIKETFVNESNKVSRLGGNIYYSNKYVAERKRDKRKFLKKFIGKASVIGVSLLGYIAMWISGNNYYKNTFKNRTCDMVHETYSTVEGYIPEYHSVEINGVEKTILKKYGNVQDNGIVWRSVYDISKLNDNMSLEEMASLDLSELDDFTNESIKVDEENIEKYENNLIEVEKISINEVTDVSTNTGIIICINSLLFLLNAILFVLEDIIIIRVIRKKGDELKGFTSKKFFEFKDNRDNGFGFCELVCDLKELYEKIKVEQDEINRHSKRPEESLKEIKEIYEELKRIIDTNPYLKYAKNLPQYEEQVSEIDENYALVREIIKDSQNK